MTAAAHGSVPEDGGEALRREVERIIHDGIRSVPHIAERQQRASEIAGQVLAYLNRVPTDVGQRIKDDNDDGAQRLSDALDNLPEPTMSVQDAFDAEDDEADRAAVDASLAEGGPNVSLEDLRAQLSVRDALTDLIAKWYQDQTTYPPTDAGGHAAAAVRLCAQELADVIASAPVGGRSQDEQERRALCDGYDWSTGAPRKCVLPLGHKGLCSGADPATGAVQP